MKKAVKMSVKSEMDDMKIAAENLTDSDELMLIGDN